LVWGGESSGYAFSYLASQRSRTPRKFKLPAQSIDVDFEELRERHSFNVDYWHLLSGLTIHKRQTRHPSSESGRRRSHAFTQTTASPNRNPQDVRMIVCCRTFGREEILVGVASG